MAKFNIFQTMSSQIWIRSTFIHFLGASAAFAAIACSARDAGGVAFTSGGAVPLGIDGSREPGDPDPAASDDDGDGDEQDPGEGGGEAIKFDTLLADVDADDMPFGPPGCRYIDALFVVDVSGSMGEEKDNLNANFPQFVAVLDNFILDPSNAAIAYRLGLTNSAVVDNVIVDAPIGLDGELYDGQGGPKYANCDMQGKRWIDGPAPTVADTFACAAPLPKSKCEQCPQTGIERPLDAIEKFIEKSAPGGVNQGFYRGEDSLLVIVLLTDEDDDPKYSSTTPAKTKAALDQFVGGEQRYVVVTIAGPAYKSCYSEFGQAAPAPVLHEFTASVPNGVIGSICDGDLAASLAQALEVIVQACDDLPPPAG